MHTFWLRAQSIAFSWALSVMLLSFGCYLSASFEVPEHVTEIADVTVHSVTHVDGDRIDFDEASLSITVNADLSPVFNWNAKQLFVYLVAEYTGKSGMFNQAVLWDDIIQSREAAKINVVSRKPEYKLYDLESEIGASTFNISLNWDVHPNIGPLHQHRGAFHTIEFPPATPYQYSRKGL